MRMMILPLVLAAGACGAQTGPGDGQIWALQSLDGKPFAARATLDLSVPGRISGRAPCNGFGAELRAELPAFDPGPIRATRRACPELAAENAFLQALKGMSRAEQSGGRLVLTSQDGREMVFIPAPAE